MAEYLASTQTMPVRIRSSASSKGDTMAEQKDVTINAPTATAGDNPKPQDSPQDKPQDKATLKPSDLL